MEWDVAEEGMSEISTEEGGLEKEMRIKRFEWIS